MVALLTNQLQKEKAMFLLDNQKLTAISKLKDLFTKTLILRHFNLALPICIKTNALDFAIKAVLS